MPNKPADYHAIALWGRQLASFRYYIEDQQERAAADGAPVDAVFKRDGFGQDGKWMTVSQLKEGHPFRADYERYLADLESHQERPYYSRKED